MNVLPYDEWRETLETLHMWPQIVGKIQLALAPPVNHLWHIGQQVTARGLRTGPLPHGDRTFEIELDFVEHECRLTASDGAAARIPLRSMPVAEFHDELTAALDAHGLHVEFWRRPYTSSGAASTSPSAASRVGPLRRIRVGSPTWRTG